jgi:adenylosuccinate lyase
VSGDAGGYIHYGATSNDILDTATGLQLRDALVIIETRLKTLLATLLVKSAGTKRLVCAGRTHGQIGVPTTFGLRFAIWASEVGRHLDRLSEMRPRVEVGQLTGAVGTQAALGTAGMVVQEGMMQILGLESVDVSNQIISRDRYAEYFFFLANIATTLDKIGVEIRSLQRTEIGEVEEAFGKNQVGSSTMPHKRNPIRSEQVCGLARIVRSSVGPALENNTLWDERDLTNSSPERILFPEATILCDHVLVLMNRVLEGLTINEDRVRENLWLLQGVNMAESVMIELVRKGLGRQDAHETVRNASMEALATKRPLDAVLLEDPGVRSLVSQEELSALIDPEHYIGTAVEQVDAVIRKLTPLTLQDGGIKDL